MGLQNREGECLLLLTRKEGGPSILSKEKSHEGISGKRGRRIILRFHPRKSLHLKRVLLKEKRRVSTPRKKRANYLKEREDFSMRAAQVLGS